MIPTTFVVSPAYGRDYKNKKDVLAAWTQGKAFVHETQMLTGGGTYISTRDIPEGHEVQIRYNKKMSLVLIKNKKGE